MTKRGVAPALFFCLAFSGLLVTVLLSFNQIMTIELLTAKAERITARIERWEQKPQTEKRLAKLEKQRNRLSKTQSKIDDIINTPDTFSLNYQNGTDYPYLEVNIFDSIYDDTYVANDPLLVRTSATHTRPTGSNSWTSTLTLSHDFDWDVSRHQSFTCSIGDFSEYTSVTATVLNTSDVVLASETIV